MLLNWPSILVWGLVATAVLSVLMRGSQALGLTRIDLPFILGAVFTADRDKAGLYGLVVHSLNGWLFSILYALVFQQLGHAAWWTGALLGLLHGLFIFLVVLPVIPGLHPRMASSFAGPQALKPLQPPGFLALNYGKWTPVVSLAAHVLYGLLLGAFYQPL